MVAKKRAKKKSKMEKQVELIIGTMAGVIILVIVMAVVFYAMNNFTYLGMEFKRTRYGTVLFYTTSVPLFNINREYIGSLTVNFRNDPRDLRDISVDTDGDIRYLPSKRVYISIEPDIEECEDSGIATTALGMFVSGMGLKPKSAFSDKNYANEQGYPWIKCWNATDSTVLMIKGGDETEITETKENCYELSFKDCEVLRVTEKFAMKVLEQHMSYVQITKQN